MGVVGEVEKGIKLSRRTARAWKRWHWPQRLVFVAVLLVAAGVGGALLLAHVGKGIKDTLANDKATVTPAVIPPHTAAPPESAPAGGPGLVITGPEGSAPRIYVDTIYPIGDGKTVVKNLDVVGAGAGGSVNIGGQHLLLEDDKVSGGDGHPGGGNVNVGSQGYDVTIKRTTLKGGNAK